MGRAALSAVLLGAVISLTGCLNKENVLRLASENGVIVYSNGFVCAEEQIVSGEIARELGMAHVSADEDVLDVLEAGENSRYGNHVSFHSAGSSSAAKVCRDCDNAGIEIRGVYSKEAFTSERFRDNVLKVVNYDAPADWVFGEHLSLGGRKNESRRVGGEHYFLPRTTKTYVKENILNSQKVGKNLTNGRRR